MLFANDFPLPDETRKRTISQMMKRSFGI